jgi:hypothetical protein
MPILLLCLAGCRGPDPWRGFPLARVESVAKDAGEALRRLFPPAGTGFRLLQPADDPFGRRLLEELRAIGYAVAEYAPPAARRRRRGGASSRPEAEGGLAFAYLAIPGPGELRLALRPGEEELSRLYLCRDDVCLPAGEWTRRRDPEAGEDGDAGKSPK